MRLNLNSKGLKVKSLKDARSRFLAWRERRTLRASQMRNNCGLVTDDDGNPVAMISFNGRVWGAKEIDGCPGCYTTDDNEKTIQRS